jgi:hypothetical protein
MWEGIYSSASVERGLKIKAGTQPVLAPKVAGRQRHLIDGCIKQLKCSHALHYPVALA